jgi:ATP-dependent helicase/nuclease subunit A
MSGVAQASEAQAAAGGGGGSPHARPPGGPAADPAVSAFVAASAGSGKTKLLIDRLLRLLLRPEADPARIQCLTYTRAAAAEMALRLQATLARWVTLPEAELRAELAVLQPEPTPALLTRARALFATVLDLPGGMRIGTLHAFCQSLLRRFPLEAAISPHFRVIETFDAATALREAGESALTTADSGPGRADLEDLAGLIDVARLEGLIGALQADRERLAVLRRIGPDAVAAAQPPALRAPAGDAAVA